MITVALAGKPNAGKSTFFSAATAADVDIANYPFTTIDPNRGVSYVRTRCPCLDREERCGNEHCRDGNRYVPVELLDVAGLVPEAHTGRGLGNQFLDALSDADVIITVVDAAGATDEEGEPVEPGTSDPREEVGFVESELDHWIASILERNWETVTRQSRSPEFNLEEALLDVLTGVGAGPGDLARAFREATYPDDPRAWEDDDRLRLATAVRERIKPVVVAANKVDIAPDDSIEGLLELDQPVIPATADGEQALRRGDEAGVIEYAPGDESFEIVGEATDEQREGLERIAEVMERWGGTGIQAALDTAVYDVLERITVYPVENETRWTDGDGNVLPDAFLLEADATPHDLGYAVHSDIGDGYLHAVDGRTNRRIGEDHELSEGDVVKIVSTAG